MNQTRVTPYARAIAEAGHLAYGLPQERLARVAARRAFVEMKIAFMQATSSIEGSLGVLLQRKVRQTCEPIELWRLREVVLQSLPPQHPRTSSHRMELRQQLDSLFPDSGCETDWVPLR
jgi:hypothetical protein